MVNYTEEGKNTEFDMMAQKAKRATVIWMIRKMKAISRYVVDKNGGDTQKSERKMTREIICVVSIHKVGFQKQSWSIIPAGEKLYLDMVTDVQLK